MRGTGTQDTNAATKERQHKILGATLTESRAGDGGVGDRFPVLELEPSRTRGAGGKLLRKFNQRPDGGFTQVGEGLAAPLAVHREHRLHGQTKQTGVGEG